MPAQGDRQRAATVRPRSAPGDRPIEDRPLRIARLHLITPDTVGDAVVAATRVALAAGAPWVQVRTKSGTDGERLAHLRAIRAAAAEHGAACLGNDRVDLALAGDADGVHVGADDLPVDVVRALAPHPFIVGATARDPESARRARDAGADYLGVGPVYATTTKTGLPDPIGLRGLAAVAEAVDLPVIAISGITPALVAEVLDAGAHGVAAVGAVFGVADVGAATRAFLDALGEAAVAPASGGIR